MSEFLVPEQWKIINEFPEYKISNLGQVKNIVSNKINNGSINPAGYRIHRFYFYDTQGNRHIKDVRIHLIVAQYFVENDDPEHKTHIDFVDKNILNIVSTNLRWCSPKELPPCNKRNRTSKLSGKPVCEYDLKGRLIRIWINAIAVSKVYPISARTIHDPCTYKSKTAYGRQWRYYETTQGQSIPAAHLRPYDLNLLHNKLKKKTYHHEAEVPKKYLFNPDPIVTIKDALTELITHSSLTPLQKQDLRQANTYINQLEEIICQLAKQTELPEELELLVENLLKNTPFS